MSTPAPRLFIPTMTVGPTLVVILVDVSIRAFTLDCLSMSPICQCCEDFFGLSHLVSSLERKSLFPSQLVVYLGIQALPPIGLARGHMSFDVHPAISLFGHTQTLTQIGIIAFLEF
ncbi:hypothetical protein K435DRAFT_854391 [Dendrothele bispora CBS 962.96]|uniref:Uncharacterized protein n=1 Tax=Dendrothele bispora (strain CBS 962.96) TaxID=1314807 RepID=A0A4V4HH06_DENBC|nr:hypothetical protein K435DRAFT_854391 [Dendrothele bispora CBS 962.96]